MKRIKTEEIQETIRNYLKQRNLTTTPRFLLLSSSSSSSSSPSPSSSSSSSTSPSSSQVTSTSSTSNHRHTPASTTTTTTTTPAWSSSSSSSLASSSSSSSILVDYSHMVSTDTVLLESSINDYYSYCLSSLSFETDYFKELDALEKFIEKSENKSNEQTQLRQLFHPILIYMCIDLIGLGLPVTDKAIKLFEKAADDEIKSLVNDLIAFEQTSGREKSKKLIDLIENKWRVCLSPGEWQRFVNFLINSRCYLLLRIVNLNLQIVSRSDTLKEIINMNHPSSSNHKSTPSAPQLVTESRSFKSSNVMSSHEPSKPSPGLQNQQLGGASARTNDSISLKSLQDCIQTIRAKPATINGACCFYLTDTQHKITSGTLSPDYRYGSFTADDESSIYLYDLMQQPSSTSSSSTTTTTQTLANRRLTGGHANTVLKSRFTHDSTHLISCDFDGLVCAWHVDRAALAATYAGHVHPVWDVETYSSLNLFATCSKDGTARLWSFDRVYPLRVYVGHQADVNCVRFHPNASYLATASSDKTVRLWSAQTCEFVRLFCGHRGRVFALAFSPDGNYLASAGEDKKVKIWDLRMGSQLRELRGHTGFIHALTFDNHSQIVCSGGLDKTVKFWDMNQTSGGARVAGANGSTNPNTSNSKNPLLSSSLSSSLSWSSSSLPYSTELINSTNVDFDVYSMSVDSHNVFYLAGARKPTVVKDTTRLGADSEMAKFEPPLPPPPPPPPPVSTTSTTTPPPKQQSSHQPQSQKSQSQKQASQRSSKLTEKSSSNNETTSVTSSGGGGSVRKVGVSTRKSSAAAAALAAAAAANTSSDSRKSSNSHSSSSSNNLATSTATTSSLTTATTTTTTTNAISAALSAAASISVSGGGGVTSATGSLSTATTPSQVNYDFLNNDDLYEV